MDKNTLQFHYKLNLENNNCIEYTIKLDPKTLLTVNSSDQTPEWATYTDKKGNTKPCYVSSQLEPLVDLFKDIDERQDCHVEIITAARTYSKITNCITALRSLVGLIMVTSNDPTFNRFRPLIDSHLPFSTITESTYRLIATYLLAQYFRNQNGKNPDWNLENIDNIMFMVKERNEQVCQTISKAFPDSIIVKAVETLDALSSFAGLSQNTTWMTRLESLFTENSNWLDD